MNRIEKELLSAVTSRGAEKHSRNSGKYSHLLDLEHGVRVGPAFIAEDWSQFDVQRIVEDRSGPRIEKEVYQFSSASAKRKIKSAVTAALKTEEARKQRESEVKEQEAAAKIVSRGERLGLYGIERQ